MLLSPLKFFHGSHGPDGLSRFRAALEGVEPGGEAEAWVRLPINLGDLVLALPSLFTVMRVWEREAQARGVSLRFVVTGKRPVALFQEAVPQVFGGCHVDDDVAWAGSPLQLLRHWGKARPLALINYTKSDRIKVAAWMAGVPIRAGIADGSNNWCYHFSHPYESWEAIGHRVFRYGPLTQWLAGSGELPRFARLDPFRFGGNSVLALLRSQGWEGGPYVVFGPNPNIKVPDRRWYPLGEPWRRLAALARAAGITPVLAGGPEHREDLEAMAREHGALCMAGRTTLPQLMALAANAVGAITVDTGIAHLAAATGRPLVVIFSRGSEHRDLPCGPAVVALRGNPAGAPVYPTPPGSMDLCGDPWAATTTTIPAERAWRVLEALRAEGGPAEPVPEP